MYFGIPEDIDYQVDRAKASISLSEFTKQAWHIIEPSTKLQWNWHLDVLCEHLEAVSRGDIRNLLINIPFRSLKSTIIAIMWPSWTWTQFPHEKWLYGSYAANLAIRDSVRCRRVVESAWYRERWPEIVMESDQNRADEFANTKTGHRLSVSVGSGGTGKGADCIVIDDSNQAKDAYSDGALEKVNNWFDTTIVSRLNDPNVGKKVVVQQRIHENDLSGHLLKKGGYDHLILPAEFDDDAGAPISNTSLDYVDPRTEKGELMFPNRLGAKVLSDFKRDLGEIAYQAQVNQNPMPAKGGLVNREDFKFYKALPEMDYYIHSFDFTFKESKKSDYVAGLCIGVKGANKYLMPKAVHEKLNYTGMKSGMRTFVYKYNQYREIVVEAKANGEAILSDLKDEFPAMYGYCPTDSKLARFASITPEIEAGNVFLPDPQCFEDSRDWVEELISQCIRMPNVSHDDLLDALTQAILRIKTYRGTWENKLKDYQEALESEEGSVLADAFGWDIS